MENDDAAPCRHAGVPPATVVDSVARLIENLGAHPELLHGHGLTQQEFSAALPAAIERIRGRKSADNAPRRDFLVSLLHGLVDRGIATALEVPKKGADTVYRLAVKGLGDVAVIQKGAPDGVHSSVNWQVPDWAEETYLWWVSDGMTRHPGSDVAKGVGRLRKVFFSDPRRMLDGVIFQSGLCGARSRPCPKSEYAVDLGGQSVPPPCIYVMPDHQPDGRSWNWNGATPRRFPELLLGAFGIPPEKAPFFTGHVGFQSGERDTKRTVITSRFGPARVTTYRS
ncbi:hypothetical protein OG562_15860 [Streptomyces sp. NBC_01275]|uniref:hypothetical protein n=1 Tax=Streptomyces sp. NBC_01275 TaxID=2903807 RepID=UPI00225506F6|nr:hypothetical protein [Streptomyces sp. NBC_01275]MCX4762425.1 hypothetical protein [Streptomyces sp. NBC_01275]